MTTRNRGRQTFSRYKSFAPSNGPPAYVSYPSESVAYQWEVHTSYWLRPMQRSKKTLSVTSSPCVNPFGSHISTLGGSPSGVCLAAMDSAYRPLLYNAAYQRLFAKLRGNSPRSELAMSVAGLGKSMEFLRASLTRAGELLRNYLRRQNYLADRSSKEWADGYLGMKFGILATLEDVRNAISVLASTPQPGVVVGRYRSKQFGTSPTQQHIGANVVTLRWVTRFSMRSSLAANFTIHNPNVFLANNLGLFNPLTLAWDLIPWSWVIGMFVNVNQMLRSVTDQAGVTLHDAAFTWHYFDGVARANAYTTDGYPGSGSAIETFEIKRRERYAALPYPSVSFRIPGLDAGLAVTALALLVQRAQKVRIPPSGR